MSGESAADFAMKGDVGVVTLARPPHNLLNAQTIVGIVEAFEGAVEAGARALLLQSGLKHFSAGADVSMFAAGSERPALSPMQALARLEAVGVPTVAAVRGVALGGGFELALACDFIVAAHSAKLGLTEASLGLAPLMGGVQRVVQRAGAARGKEIAMFARRHDAATLEQWGILNLVVEQEDLAEASLAFATQLAQGPTIALGAIKQIAAQTTSGGLAAGDAAQAEALRPVLESEDMQTGTKAFLTSGRPTGQFAGR